MIHKFCCVCVCVWKAVLSPVMFSEVCIGKSFVSKGGLWVSFLSCPLWNQNPQLVTESSVCDIPGPPLPTVAHGDITNEELWSWQAKQMSWKKQRSSLPAAVPSHGEVGVGSEALSLQLTPPTMTEPSPYRTLWRQQGVAAENLTDCFPTPFFFHLRGKN